MVEVVVPQLLQPNYNVVSNNNKSYNNSNRLLQEGGVSNLPIRGLRGGNCHVPVQPLLEQEVALQVQGIPSGEYHIVVIRLGHEVTRVIYYLRWHQ